MQRLCAPTDSPCCCCRCLRRSLIHDLGKALDCGAHMTSLRREGNGDQHVKDAWQAEELIKALKDRPEVRGVLVVVLVLELVCGSIVVLLLLPLLCAAGACGQEVWGAAGARAGTVLDGNALMLHADAGRMLMCRHLCASCSTHALCTCGCRW